MRLGIDLGTGSLKLMAVDEGGRALGTASRPYRIVSPAPGAAETDPEEWIAALRDSWAELSAALAASGADRTVESIGLGGHMHGFVTVDAAGRTIYPALLWPDTRGAEFLGEFDKVPAEARARLMNAPAAGMAAVDILWLKKYHPQVYADAAAFLFPKDYVRFRLTGKIAGDPGDSSAGLIYDFATGTWSEEVLAAFGIDREKLPPIGGSFELAGFVTEKAAAETGLPGGVPVAIGSSDAACALAGSGLFTDFFSGGATAAAQIAVGSGAQVIMPYRGLPEFDPALNCFETAFPGVRYRMAAMLNAGVALEWVRGALSIEWDDFYAAWEAGDLSLPRDLFFLPYLSGERSPYNDPASRGSWIGVGLHHDRMQLLAAALLGVACTVRLGVEHIGFGPETTAYLVGGSARRVPWRRLLASVIGRPLELCAETDSSARGAAYIGGMVRGVIAGGAALPPDAFVGPAPAPTLRIDPEEIPWIDSYYGKFNRLYGALYGKDGAYSG